MSKLMGIEQARYVFDNEVDVTYSGFLDILRWAIDDYDALLADREALVRYVVTLHGAYLLEGEILNNKEYQALSQELRDEINAI